MTKLNWKLLTKKRAGVSQGLPPGKEDLSWVTNTVTLIDGERDAILVDAFLSVEHSKELVDWIVESGKNLIAIYITHAHGDHFLGLKLLLDRFPDARAFATATAVTAMQEQIKPDYVRSFWESRFPGQVPSEFVLPEALQGDALSLEGEELHIMHLGHTDTANTTAATSGDDQRWPGRCVGDRRCAATAPAEIDPAAGAPAGESRLAPC